ncbi:Alpha/Beta hydrolase protein [Dactylonectria macrodidyma]|uniref:Alpha/Beta hydrolase protein n=1 Tax=Dactylonectria macrodidyma TaxID=307937 RepID=A0A9P9JRM0_9HYPO|nr:Alpha/Beta hydrolase protein [Dactylonectria macrodidyma]
MVHAQPQRHGENGSGFRVLVRDAIISLGIIIAGVPTILLFLVIRRLRSSQEIPFKEDFHRSLIRGLSILPVRTIRWHLKHPTASSILVSNRFKNSIDQLCVRVSAAACEGYWICQGPPGNLQTPKESDVILLWMHGGAYCFGSPLDAAVTLLRVAEIVATRGVSISIFSVDYTLAPTAVFPCQQLESVAAYRHLLDVENIKPAKIVVAGDSAGGHLALTCLMALSQENLPKPAGALLLWPWINLRNSSPSFEQNENKDMLNKKLLDRCTELATGVATNAGSTEIDVMNLTRPLRNELTWKRILPAQTWINVGAHDLFVHDIKTFVQQAKASGASVDLEVTGGMPHGWQLTVDKLSEHSYRNLDPTDEVLDGMMQGSANVAEGLLTLLDHGNIGHTRETLA